MSLQKTKFCVQALPWTSVAKFSASPRSQVIHMRARPSAHQNFLAHKISYFTWQLFPKIATVIHWMLFCYRIRNTQLLSSRKGPSYWKTPLCSFGLQFTKTQIGMRSEQPLSPRDRYFSLPKGRNWSWNPCTPRLDWLFLFSDWMNLMFTFRHRCTQSAAIRLAVNAHLSEIFKTASWANCLLHTILKELRILNRHLRTRSGARAWSWSTTQKRWLCFTAHPVACFWMKSARTDVSISSR